MAIASSRESFVSESFLIGSANDKKTVVIEKSTERTALYDPDTNFIILTNHFQSGPLVNTPLNIENMANRTSVYRHEKIQELLENDTIISVSEAAAILRNRSGKSGENIGNGNELAINQLIAHHAIIFEPEKLLFWISTAPWQLGPFIAYDLESIFNTGNIDTSLFIDDIMIPADPFLHSSQYDDFIYFRQYADTIARATKRANALSNEAEIIDEFITSNPEFYQTYAIVGRYYQEMKSFDAALKYYNLALTKEISSITELEKLKRWIEDCRKP